MLPGKKYTPEEIVGILIRRWWMILLPLVVGSAAGVLTYERMPVQYRSETLIMVFPQRVPEEVVKLPVASMQERLLSVNEQIRSRSRLERIISDFDLYKEQLANGVMEDVVQRMRGDIDVKVEGRELFRVSYKNADPTTAQKVTERLASLFIDENLRDRANRTQSTSGFIESQLEDAKRRLLEQEARLEEYRQRYAGQLPSQLTSNLQAMQSAQMQLQSVGDSINRARERRLLFERQLADAQTLPAAVIAPGIAASGEEPAQLTASQQLESARARLDALRLRYTPDHPDIRTLERTVRDLQTRADEEAAKPPSDGGRRLSTQQAARQKKVGDLQAELDVIDRQIGTGLADEARLKKAIADYQAKIDLLPTRESELVELTRNYQTLQDSYTGLLVNLEDARRAEALVAQGGEQFKILDGASLPEKPYNQRQRLTVLAGGALGGLALGLGLVGFLEYRDSSFKSEEDVLRVLTLPVLALVPLMMLNSERLEHQRRKRKVLAGTLAVVVMLGSAAALAFWRLQP